MKPVAIEAFRLNQYLYLPGQQFNCFTCLCFYQMRKTFFILSVFFSQWAAATTFTVISPLDNGAVGTLRWAIESANNNSPAAGTDYIVFNIPIPQPASHIIQLNSELPFLTSNIVIDGTTQPNGAPFGITDARIILTPKLFNSCKRGLVIRDADHVEIYGLYFAGFISKTPQVAEIWSDGIFMCNVNHVIIGAPGKGNAFTLNYHCIRNDALTEAGGPINGAVSSDIFIQNNYIGKNYTGQTFAQDGAFDAVELMNVHDVQVGGYAANEANEFMVFSDAVKIKLNTATPAAASLINVVNNNFIVGTSTPALPVLLVINGITITDAAAGYHLVNISGNKISQYVNGITLSSLKHPFNIARNIIDCDRTRNAYPTSTGINISLCDSGTIGGLDSTNTIRNIKNFGIYLSGTKNIGISRDSIYCDPKGISIVSPATVIPVINQLLIDPARAVSGNTCAGCKVEIFSTQDCSAEISNGETFLRARIADANGDWNYTGPVDCNTSFTVTDLNNTTSEFTTAINYIIDTSALIKRDATCNQSNGFIKGIKIYAGVDFHWEDNLGNIINTVDTNLLNLAPGFYKLVCSKQNAGCRPFSTSLFEIRNIIPVINTSGIQLIHPSTACRVSGSITGISITSPDVSLFSYRWVNQLGVPVGTTLNLSNVPAGTYSLTVYVSFDPACTASAGPFTLMDKPAPAFDLSAIRINNATCNHANGNIAGILISNAYASQQFKWYDERGNIVSNIISLSNVAPGKYYLQYDDASPCPPINTPVFTIGNNGLVSIDVSNIIIEPSGCTVIKGAIKNIVVTGANLFEWVNTVSGNIVGNNVDLLQVPDGNYKLRAFDTNYGCADSTEIFVVPLTAIQNLTVQSKLIKDETCTGSNGSISNIILQPGIAGYNFKWIRPLQDTFATSLNINNLAANNYTLIAYDSNGCVQTILQQTITDHPAPVLDESNITVANDTCTQRLGSVLNMNYSSGTAPYNYQWYHAPSNTIAGNTKNLLQLSSGNYYMILKDVNGCADTSSVFFVGDESPVIAAPLYSIVYAKRNTSAYIKPVITAPGVYELYDAAFSTTPLESNGTGIFRTAALATDRDYWIRKSIGSCNSAKTKVHVYVIDFSKVFVPNAFTPNNDGLNDVLRINVFGNIVIDQFVIYNRWGQQVFLSGDIRNGWDGTNNGISQPPGTYAWIIQGYDIDGTPLHLRGTVTLIK
ncbi:MAG: gliding motility-associated C-terminal domain-containing protein [Ferruginibacter sp.]